MGVCCTTRKGSFFENEENILREKEPLGISWEKIWIVCHPTLGRIKNRKTFPLKFFFRDMETSKIGWSYLKTSPFSKCKRQGLTCHFLQCLYPVSDIQFYKNVFDVEFYGVFRDKQFPRNFFIPNTGGHQLHDLRFPVSEAIIFCQVVYRAPTIWPFL